MGLAERASAAQHTLPLSRSLAQAEAERRLLKAALEDPRNQRFVLLSESCAPLYPPQVVYLQLLSDGKSRLNACNQPSRLAERWGASGTGGRVGRGGAGRLGWIPFACPNTLGWHAVTCQQC
jgi:hypothetical protein